MSSFANAYAVLLRRYINIITGSNASIEHEGRLSLDQLDELVRTIFDARGSLDFGLKLGSKIHPSDFGLVGYALMNCPNLLQAMHKLNRYRQQLKAGFSTSFEVQDSEIIYTIDGADDLICLFPMVEFDFASGVQFARMLAGPTRQHDIRLLNVNFQHGPLAPLETYESVFQCPVAFECEQNSIVIDRRSIDVPVHGANPKLFEMLDEKLKACVAKALNPKDLSLRVKEYLQERERDKVPTQSDAAQHFFMSVSCFKNHLRKHGTSYQKLYDEVRCEEAKRLLQREEVSLKEISFQLGFANQSAFNRAFKRWTQANPSEYRSKYLDQRESISTARNAATSLSSPTSPNQPSPAKDSIPA